MLRGLTIGAALVLFPLAGYAWRYGRPVCEAIEDRFLQLRFWLRRQRLSSEMITHELPPELN